MTEAAIAVRGLAKRYGPREVLTDVSFAVARGELVALLGPNGAGKTTTVEIVEGFRSRDAGEVRVLGLDPATDATPIRGRLGIMLQEGGVHPRTTPRQALRLHRSLAARPADPDALLGLLGLEPHAGTPYRRLSRGERQRLGLALALVGRPEVLVLDEPTAGLDAEARTSTRLLVAGLRDAGMAVLLTTHDLDDVERLADRVVILDRGRVVADGRPGEITAGDAGALLFRTEPALAEPRRRSLEERVRARIGAELRISAGEPDGRCRVEVPAVSPPLVAALAEACAAEGVLITELRAGRTSLEERYLELIGRPGRGEHP